MKRKHYISAVILALLGGLLAAVYGNYRDDVTTARERIQAGSRLARTACGQIEYGVTGEGPPVLMVHGAGGGFDQGLDFGEGLARRGFRVIAVSRFGYLRTPLPEDPSAAAQADAHACLLDTLGISRVAVIGGSAGAPSSLQLALRHPARVSALVLLVPALYVPRPEGAPSVKPAPGTQLLFETALRSDFVYWAAFHLAREAVIEGLLATRPAVVEAASEAERARVRRLLTHILPVSSRRLGLLNDAAVTSSIPRYELEQVGVPVLAISVEDDLFGTYEAARYTASQIPGAKFIGYAAGGHVWVGHHVEVLDRIEDFFKR